MSSGRITLDSLASDQWAPPSVSVSGQSITVGGHVFPATGKPIRYDSDRDPSSVLINGQLVRKPLPPLAPVAEIETWERQSITYYPPMTMAELFNKLPRGVNFENIKLHVENDGGYSSGIGGSYRTVPSRIFFEVKKITPNSFYEEELKVYHAKLAVYELELKMWSARVEEAKSRDRAEYEAAFSKPPPVVADPNAVKNDVVTRQWLEAVKAGEQTDVLATNDEASSNT